MNALGWIDAVTSATASEWNATYFIFALIVGDTVGDPFKDTSGPSMNILISLMTITAVVFAPLFARIGGLFFEIKPGHRLRKKHKSRWQDEILSSSFF